MLCFLIFFTRLQTNDMKRIADSIRFRDIALDNGVVKNIKIKFLLFSLYYAEACNEFAELISASLLLSSKLRFQIHLIFNLYIILSLISPFVLLVMTVKIIFFKNFSQTLAKINPRFNFQHLQMVPIKLARFKRSISCNVIISHVNVLMQLAIIFAKKKKLLDVRLQVCSTLFFVFLFKFDSA